MLARFILLPSLLALYEYATGQEPPRVSCLTARAAKTQIELSKTYMETITFTNGLPFFVQGNYYPANG
jgi:hypothetical protein